MSNSVSYELFKAKNEEINILEAISPGSHVVAQADAIPFDTNYVLLGSGITHIPGETTFDLEAPGVYKLSFSCIGINSSASPSVAATFSLNDIIIPATFMGATTNDTNTNVMLNSQTIIQVLPNTSAIFKIINLSSNTTTFFTSNIIIEKLL